MPAQAQQVYKSQADILAEILAAMLVRMPDANVGADTLLRIWAEVYANTAEGLYLGMQLTHDDMFIQTASALALIRAGEMYGRPQKVGLLATGSVVFAGAGGIYIPLGSIVSAPRASQDDTLDFLTTTDGTIPFPGIPTAPVAADGGAGALPAGTYEYAITFQTAAGETVIGAVSNALVLTINHQTTLTAIPLGGVGTTGRRVYRRVNAGAWARVSTIADNVTVGITDNNAAPAGVPPVVSTAEQITLNASASDVGLSYNVAIGAISDISDAPSGLSSVTNTVPFVGGTDPEDIETFRNALLSFVRAPQSGGPQDLAAWATAIDGVESATVFPNVDLGGGAAPGTVSVRISATGGLAPSAPLIATVLAALQARDLANITILVGGFTAHNIDVAIATTLATGYVLADVTPSVVTALTNYINSVPVGGTVYKSGVLKATFGLPGIVNVTTTFADTTVAATEKPIAHTLTVT